MRRYAPHAQDLASRDVVSRAIATEMLRDAAAGRRPIMFCSSWNIWARS